MLFGKRTRKVKRILVVEDEPLTAFDNETLIADAGYEVVGTVDRYAEAVALLEREDVDLILSDIRLNGERSGLDLARFAKARGVPTVFATGHAPDDAGGDALGCLLKPYSGKTLRAALDAVDRHLSDKPAKPPKGFTLYGVADAD